MEPYEGFSVGIDFSMDALVHFDLKNGQPVLCPVERICRTFRENCADLVVANPPYYSLSSSRPSPDRIRMQARTGDSLTVHRFVFAAAWLLRQGGILVISTSPDREKETEQSITAAGFTRREIFRENGVSAIRAECFSRI